MKIKTMTLPTGEFILVVGNLPYEIDFEASRKRLQETTGAADVLYTSDDVEVEDAVIQEEARRHDPSPYSSLADSMLKVTWGDAFLPTASSRDHDHISDLLTGGRKFSPAGLVKGQPGDPDLLSNPEFAQGGEPGADPEPHFVIGEPFDVGPQAPCPCWPAGDRVYDASVSRCSTCPLLGDVEDISVVRGED